MAIPFINTITYDYTYYLNEIIRKERIDKITNILN